MQQDGLNDEHVTILELGTNTMQELTVNGHTLIGIRDERLYLNPHHAANFMYAISGGRALVSGRTEIEGVSIDADAGQLTIGETVLTEQAMTRLNVRIRETGNDVTVVNFDVE